MNKTIITICLSCLVLTGCATLPHKEEKTASQPQVKKLQAQLDEIFNAPRYEHAIWGVEIRSLTRGDLLYDHNGQINLRPASNNKVLPTAAALYYLGPDYKYATYFLGNNAINADGTMPGDLVIRGTGDPSFSGRYSKGSTTSIAMMEEIVEKLKAKGIKKIEGNIIGDDNYFDDTNLAASWMHGYFASPFSAEISALSFNENCFDYKAWPGKKVGDPIGYEMIIPTDYVHLTSKATTVAANERTDFDVDRTPGLNNPEIYGQISLSKDTVKDGGSVSNPTLFFATVFYETLKRKGIEVTGKPMDIDDCPEPPTAKDVLYTHESMPLAKIIRITNRVSQNLYAEQITKTLGELVKGEGSTAKGTEAIEQFLGRIGVDTTQLYVVDGSGLSQTNLVQPHQFVQVLSYMYNSPWKEAWWESLPPGGVNGDVATMMKDTTAADSIRGKTGYILHVRCFSGYATAKNGEVLVYSMMCNNHRLTMGQVDEAMDKATVLLSEFTR
jgi:D-alanyl-D-alanine carboxypeptidase/D-alanyl-D-alanine-endopeptidase (penicillin-binding protein 4)